MIDRTEDSLGYKLGQLTSAVQSLNDNLGRHRDETKNSFRELHSRISNQEDKLEGQIEANAKMISKLAISAVATESENRLKQKIKAGLLTIGGGSVGALFTALLRKLGWI